MASTGFTDLTKIHTWIISPVFSFLEEVVNPVAIITLSTSSWRMYPFDFVLIRFNLNAFVCTVNGRVME